MNQVKITKRTAFIIRVLHTTVWVIVVAAIFYALYAAIVNRLNIYLWISWIIIAIEIIALVANKMICPFTTLYIKHTGSWKMGDDILIPRWMARYNAQIFTPPLVAALIILIYRLVQMR
jgi:hypothetical protein